GGTWWRRAAPRGYGFAATRIATPGRLHSTQLKDLNVPLAPRSRRTDNPEGKWILLAERAANAAQRTPGFFGGARCQCGSARTQADAAEGATEGSDWRQGGGAPNPCAARQAIMIAWPEWRMRHSAEPAHERAPTIINP